MNRTKLGGEIWFSLLFFGLVGQLAWIVENMYFATLCQDIFSNSGRADLSYIVTTLMVILSAVTATVTTIAAGGKCDKVGRRKPFIAWGYIVWGFTIMLFALIPMRAAGRMLFVTGAALVLFDCVMTVAGSTANDAAFNAWVADVTDGTNRGRVNAVLSVLPVFAVVIVFIGLGGLYSASSESNARFFLVLGCIPTLSGVLALFVLQDRAREKQTRIGIGSDDVFYGFRRTVVRENRMLYVTLTAYCLVAISQQTFFSYLINFVIKTLGFGDGFVIPMAVIIVGAAAVTGVFGAFFDCCGRRNFYLPLLGLSILGTLSFYLLKYLQGGTLTAVLYIGGIMMMGGILALTGALQSAFQDYIPAGCEGRFQGVRMCFSVLIPMIVGPIISMVIGLDAMGMNGEDFAPTFEIFLAAAVVAVFAVIPLLSVRRDADRLRGSVGAKS